MSTLFISDLHLDATRPEVTALFLDFLAGRAVRADALYILGDLFEAWIGDDDDAEPGPAVARALRAVADTGLPVHLMHGNRDFLLGERFARAAGVRLMAEEEVIDLHGTPTLLMHGDTLCTDDVAYQAFRAKVRDPAWQAGILAQPLETRRALARQLRADSAREMQGKAPEITDVNPAAVARVMGAHGVHHLIHGHTHRPAIHELRLEGAPARRIVLGDWYEQGSVLECDADGCRLQVLPVG